MRVLKARNVHQALPLGLALLAAEGVERPSRNGPVKIAPSPVTTVYECPLERVVFWPERDANPFFHLYEALWMLAGRNDIAPLLRYAKNIGNYSDDGLTLHGAYGYRWRNWFQEGGSGVDIDQLEIIVNTLREKPDDRRCVLAMWDAEHDLGRNGKDVPCNTMATFQRGGSGQLDLTVFCRSNDIIWGAYGANAVHFSMLLEYVALWIGCPVGVYNQISVNYHAYLDTLKTVERLAKYNRPEELFEGDPYQGGNTHFIPMVRDSGGFGGANTIDDFDRELLRILSAADHQRMFEPEAYPTKMARPWAYNVYVVLAAHEVYRMTEGELRFIRALEVLSQGDPNCDWNVAARQWLERRQAAWYLKTGRQDEFYPGSRYGSKL